MNIFKKMKDILFDEEVVEESNNKVKEEPKIQEIPVQRKSLETEPIKTEISISNNISDKSLLENDNTFPFPEFDEDEFDANLNHDNSVRQVSSYKKEPDNILPQRKVSSTLNSRNVNIMEYERKHKIEKRTDGSRFEKIETHELKEKRKFKPSPIISPVYGILNEDYKIEDIKNKNEDTKDNLDFDSVRKKAFGELESLEKTIDAPVQEFYEEVKTVRSVMPAVEKEEKVKTIDELLEDTSDVKINLEDEFDITTDIPVPDIKNKHVVEEIDEEDTLEHDLLGLIDSMYETNEEEE